ncbi:MAG: head GIN domain-containing protein [Prolixibacteraceae bacterium]|jgi:hypothetical protein|nr:head GIN domain-containing protein [Prolixibacteraceae bacterium]
MKTSKLLFVFVLVLSGIYSFAALANEKDTNRRNRETKPFHAIKVSTGIDLYLSQGDIEKIVVEAGNDIIDNLVTEVHDGVLKIYMNKSFIWKWNVERKVYVTFRELDMLTADSGSDVESQGLLQVKNLKIDASSGSDIDMEIQAEQLSVNTSSGSDTELKGTAGYLKASSSSGSDLNAGELKVKVCEVSASSGSDATIYVTERIKASASSGADIRCLGNPPGKDINESSGGDVYIR